MKCQLCESTNNVTEPTIFNRHTKVCEKCVIKYNHDYNKIAYLIPFEQEQRKIKVKKEIKDYYPFEQVLVLTTVKGRVKWIPALFSYYLIHFDIEEAYVIKPLTDFGSFTSESIVPFEGNKHLVGIQDITEINKKQITITTKNKKTCKICKFCKVQIEDEKNLHIHMVSCSKNPERCSCNNCIYYSFDYEIGVTDCDAHYMHFKGNGNFEPKSIIVNCPVWAYDPHIHI